MSWRYLLLATLSLVFLAACGGGDDDDSDSDLSAAEDRIVEAVEAFTKNQAGRVYDEYLVPAQRDQIDRDLYVTCNTRRAGVTGDVEVDESYRETSNVPSVGEDVETVAVTYVISDGDDSVTNTSHGVEADGDWYVFYPQERLDAYVAGECPE